MKYSKQLADKAIDLYTSGKHSIQAICNELNIHRDTFYDWKTRNSGFAKRIEEAHIRRLEEIGDMALSGLALLVQMYEYEEVTTEYVEGKDGKPKIKSQKKVKKIIMPNPGAVMHVLTNLDPENWKHRQTIAHTGENDGPIQTELTIKVGYGQKDEDQD